MIDPLVSLAFAMQANKGVYALLIGSGVSRSAGIPTGWEVVEDLIRKLASATGADPEPDPAAWYLNQFAEEPTYSGLLDALAKTQAERSRLLHGYFEPSEDEREQGIKQPTVAHRAIAELVAGGVVRVILTTNFDRLIEHAIEAAGVTPAVIPNADAAKGALPTTHSQCTVIKLHGDYMDSRIRNTTDELGAYPDELNRILDLVLDDYGLVVCGWSGEYDTALRDAISRASNRRFTSYWTSRGEPSELGKQLIAARSAEVIRIASADDFFGRLTEKVAALDRFDRPHPLSVRTAAAILKRYIADESHRIDLHDLVNREVENLYGSLTPERMTAAIPYSAETVRSRAEDYEALSEIARAIIVSGCYHGDEAHTPLWVRAIERIANPGGSWDGNVPLLRFRRYPALLLFYSGGIAAVAAKKYETLVELFRRPVIREPGTEDRIAIEVLNVWGVVYGDKEMARDLWPHPEPPKYWKTPTSQRLNEKLRPALREVFVQDERYERAFDEFEYLLALDCGALNNGWTPIGRFGPTSAHGGGPVGE